MTTGEITTSIIVFSIAVILFIFSIMSFLERGFLLNNAYLYASREERKTMNKKPYYKQVGGRFLCFKCGFPCGRSVTCAS